MQTTMIVQVLAPVCLALVMWGLGLTLTMADFIRVRQQPKVVGVALGIQLLIIPLFAALLCWVFQLSAPLSIGLMLLASTPGGPTANLLSFLARGNVALNITLTAINSLIGIVFVPLVVGLSLQYFSHEANAIPLQTEKLMQVVVVLLVPMMLGFWMNRRWPHLASRCEKFVTRLSILLLLTIVVVGVRNEWELIRSGVMEAGLAVLLFNVGSMGFGFLGARLLKLTRADMAAVVMELGIHNCALAVGIAMSPHLLNSAPIAVPAALYILIMYVTAGLVAYVLRRQAGSSEVKAVA
ncbi:MAG: bile acid:sodium symporter family protein [Bdellovibrionales bacterium]